MAKQIYKTRVKHGMTIDKNLHETLNRLSEQTRIPKSRLIDEALELLFIRHNIKIVDDKNN